MNNVPNEDVVAKIKRLTPEQIRIILEYIEQLPKTGDVS